MPKNPVVCPKTPNKAEDFIDCREKVILEGYRYELPKGHLDDPEERIHTLRVVLPNGLAARFVRLNRWIKISDEEQTDLRLAPSAPRTL